MHLKARPGVSVILCCYNSSSRLRNTLEHLALQDVAADVPWEIILVDNNSTDDTREKAAKIWRSLQKDVPFSIIDQPTPGLSNARQKGVVAAQFDDLLFCDDDNWLEKNYVQRAYFCMLENKNIGILAGRSEAYFERSPPIWFSAVEAAYAVGKPMTTTGLANTHNYLPGAGFVVRSKLFSALTTCSFEHLLTGRKGSSLNSGEDAELCKVARFLGYDLYYYDELFFIHYIPKQRLNWKYCINLVKSHASTQVYFYLYDYCFNIITVGADPDFNSAWRMFVKKHIKSYLGDFASIKKSYRVFRDIMDRKEGSLETLTRQKKLAKLSYALNNKKKLEVEFAGMFQLVQRLHAFKRMHPVSEHEQSL